MTNIFDLDGALARVEGDRDLLNELAGIYLDEVSKLLMAMSRARERNDIVAVAKVAHTIKGASSSFCSQTVYDAAWDVEQLLPTNTAEEIRAAYEKLLHEAERLNQAIRQEFAI